MKCLCCQEALTSQTTRFWRRLLLCATCVELARKAERELIAAHDRARAQSMIWLEQYVMAGGVLRGMRYTLPAGKLKAESGEDTRSDMPEVQRKDSGPPT